MLYVGFCRILLKIFEPMFLSDIGLQVLCVCVCVTFLSGFVIRVMVALQNEFVNFLSSAIFWKRLGRIYVISGLSFVGRFLITVLISMLVISLFKFSISSWFSFEKGYNILRICPFFQVVHLIDIQLLIQSLMMLCISVLSVVISPFSFLILFT